MPCTRVSPVNKTGMVLCIYTSTQIALITAELLLQALQLHQFFFLPGRSCDHAPLPLSKGPFSELS